MKKNDQLYSERFPVHVPRWTAWATILIAVLALALLLTAILDTRANQKKAGDDFKERVGKSFRKYAPFYLDPRIIFDDDGDLNTKLLNRSSSELLREFYYDLEDFLDFLEPFTTQIPQTNASAPTVQTEHV